MTLHPTAVPGSTWNLHAGEAPDHVRSRLHPTSTPPHGSSPNRIRLHEPHRTGDYPHRLNALTLIGVNVNAPSTAERVEAVSVLTKKTWTARNDARKTETFARSEGWVAK